PEINIRGFTSINGGSPLVLVDGIEEDISNVNPNNVESVSVLKGSGAAAIYGARGSFGVVLIQTKFTKGERIEVNYYNNVGFSTNTTRTDFVTDPYTYVKTVDDAINAYNGGCFTCYDDADMEILKKVGEGKVEPYYKQQDDGTY